MHFNRKRINIRFNDINKISFEGYIKNKNIRKINIFVFVSKTPYIKLVVSFHMIKNFTTTSNNFRPNVKGRLSLHTKSKTSSRPLKLTLEIPIIISP